MLLLLLFIMQELINTNEESPNFDFIIDEHKKYLLKNAYDAITMADCWYNMKCDVHTYMYAAGESFWKITKAMADLGYNNHSCKSFTFVMSEMHYIALNGFTNWKTRYLSKQCMNTSLDK